MSIVLQEVPVHSLITKNNGLARYKKGENVLFVRTETWRVLLTETKFGFSICSNFLNILQNSFLFGKVQSILTFKGEQSRKSVLKIDFILNV